MFSIAVPLLFGSSESLASHPELPSSRESIVLTTTPASVDSSSAAATDDMGTSASKSDKSSAKSEKKSRRRSSVVSRSEKDGVAAKSAGENDTSPPSDKVAESPALVVESSVEPMVTTATTTSETSDSSTVKNSIPVPVPTVPVMALKKAKVTSDGKSKSARDDEKNTSRMPSTKSSTVPATSLDMSPKTTKPAKAPKAEVESAGSSSSEDEGVDPSPTRATEATRTASAVTTGSASTPVSSSAPPKPARTPPQPEKVTSSTNKTGAVTTPTYTSSFSSRPFTYSLTSREPTAKVQATSSSPPKTDIVYKPAVTSDATVASTAGITSSSQIVNKSITESSTVSAKVSVSKEIINLDAPKPDVASKPVSSETAVTMVTSTRSTFAAYSRPTYAASRPYASIYSSSYSSYSTKPVSTASTSSSTSSGSSYTYSRITSPKTSPKTTTVSTTAEPRSNVSTSPVLLSLKAPTSTTQTPTNPMSSSSVSQSQRSTSTYTANSQSAAKLAFVMSPPEKPAELPSKSPVLASKPATVSPKPVLFVPKLTTKVASVDTVDAEKSIRTDALHNGPAVLSTEDVQDTLTTCGICKKPLNQPKMLPCIHSFCKNCLETLIQPRAKTLECPLCEDKATIPKNGVDGFRDNDFLTQLRGTARLPVTSPKWCDICEVPGRACERQCVDCQEPMCKTCATAHLRMKATKRHRVVELTDSDKKSLSKAQALMTKCSQHKEPITMFCTQCDVPGCDTCVLESHGDHRAVDLTQAAGEKRMVLQVTMSAICQKAAQLQSLMSAIDAIRSKITAHKQLQLMAIDDKLRDLTFAVQRAARSFVSNVERRTGESLTGIAGHYKECQAHLRMFQAVIDFGNKLLDCGAPRDIVLIEKDLVGRLKTLDDRLKSLQNKPLGDYVEKSMFVFLPGVSGDVELGSFFGDLSSDSSSLQEIQQLSDNYEQERRKAETGAVPKVQLRKAKEPWVPYFQQDTRINPTSSPIFQARQRDDLCTRSVIKALNKLTTHNLSTQVLHILECQIDSEPKLEKFCDRVVALASGHPALVPTLALLCRTLTFLSVPNEKRPTTKSTILNFLDRLCLKRFETGPGEFLATGMTPQISRSNSLSVVPLTRRSGSRSSLFESSTLPTRRPTTPTGSRSSMTDLFERNRSLYGSFGGPRKGPAPPPPSSRHSRTGSTSSTFRSNSYVDDPDSEYEVAARRRRNLCILSFVCELYKLRMVAENIVHEWIQRLARLDNDLAIEAICAILLNIGRFLDHNRSKPIIDKVFVQLGYVSGSRAASARLRCITRDVIRLRQADWKTPSRANYWRNIV